jgi:hypothetical protein
VRPYLKKKKNPSQKKGAGGIVQGEGPEFKLKYHQKKKKRKEKVATGYSAIDPSVLWKLQERRMTSTPQGSGELKAGLQST